MQQVMESLERNGADHKQAVTVVETLATFGSRGESIAEVAHDARNLVAALGLYCELLEEPGVLTPAFHHYGSELRLVVTASRRMVEKLVALETRPFVKIEANTTTDAKFAPAIQSEKIISGKRNKPICDWELPALPIANFATELAANRNLLAAIAGASISLSVEAEGGQLPVRLSGEDLTRILVNLVKNATEAMPKGGQIRLSLREGKRSENGSAAKLHLTVEDNGPGIPAKTLDKVFDSGYTTRSKAELENSGWAVNRRGLGLAITRSILEAAGGRIHASNRAEGGAHFEIELPIQNR